MSTYEYPHLAAEDIRLATLFPSKLFTAPLECHLEAYPLHQCRYSYDAVSYAWGSQKTKPHTLYCNGKALAITTTLDTALRYLRRKRKALVLWIDAVCIDQANTEEKEVQIGLMQHIYEEASQCYIWLGEPDQNLTRLFRTLRYFDVLNDLWYWYPLHRLQHAEWRAKIDTGPPPSLATRGQIGYSYRISKILRVLSYTPGCHWTVWKAARALAQPWMLDHIFRARTKDRAFNEMCNRPWFHRAWTLQELYLNQNSVVVCGKHCLRYDTLSWFDLRLQTAHDGIASIKVSHRLSHFMVFNSIDMSGEDPADEISHQYLDLKLQLMINVKDSLAGDPRDKVFGASAVLGQVGWIPPPVDYSQTTADVYIDATWAWIEHFERLPFLGLAATPHVTSGLPSWVIDWAVSGSNEHAFHTHFVHEQRSTATRESLCQPVRDLFNKNTLELRGKYVATVQLQAAPCSDLEEHDPANTAMAAGTKQKPPTRQNDLKKILLPWMGLIRAAQNTLSSKGFISNLCHILSCGHFPESKYRKLQSFNETSDDLIATFDSMPTSTCEPQRHKNPSTANWLLLFQAMAEAAEHLTLFTTDAKQVGYCFCSHMETSDQVVLVAGSDWPLVLRPVPGREDTYTLVGPAKVSGLMEGEMWPEDTNVEMLQRITLI